MKPTNKFFVFVYYVAGFVIKLLHPTTVDWRTCPAAACCCAPTIPVTGIR